VYGIIVKEAIEECKLRDRESLCSMSRMPIPDTWKVHVDWIAKDENSKLQNEGDVGDVQAIYRVVLHRPRLGHR